MQNLKVKISIQNLKIKFESGSASSNLSSKGGKY